MRNREPNSRPSSINASKTHMTRSTSDAVPGPLGRLVRCHFGHGDFQAGQLQLVSWFPRSMV